MGDPIEKVFILVYHVNVQIVALKVLPCKFHGKVHAQETRFQKFSGRKRPILDYLWNLKLSYASKI